MTQVEKRTIWWQKSDYEDFRKTARIISRAMLQGGSEIWLQTDGKGTDSSRHQHGASQRLFPDSLSERQAAFQKGDINAKKEHEETRDNWWHRFGHSRRGLEHIASIDEGQQRNINVNLSRRAVMNEQQRQQMFQKKDPLKLRLVYIQASSWARDLSLASGASDADAVNAKFDDSARKSREFYLKRISRADQANNKTNAQQTIPVFMKPVLTVPDNRLDANTSSQLRFRQLQMQKKRTADSSKEMAPQQSVEKDPSEPEPEPIAKKAAGFCANEEDVTNMSAVLTGMGPIPKRVAT
jgi:hypothetical protein